MQRVGIWKLIMFATDSDHISQSNESHKNASILYYLIHQRFILTPEGLKIMREMYREQASLPSFCFSCRCKHLETCFINTTALRNLPACLLPKTTRCSLWNIEWSRFRSSQGLAHYHGSCHSTWVTSRYFSLARYIAQDAKICISRLKRANTRTQRPPHLTGLPSEKYSHRNFLLTSRSLHSTITCHSLSLLFLHPLSLILMYLVFFVRMSTILQVWFTMCRKCMALGCTIGVVIWDGNIAR